MPEPGSAPAPWWRAALVGLAVLVVLTGIKLAIPAIGRPTPFLAYFVAILAAAWQGGLGVGLGITAVSASCGYHWFIAGTPNLAWSTVATQVLVFSLEGVVISWLAARFRDERGRTLAAANETRDAIGLLEGVLDALDVGVTVEDEKGTLVYTNAAAAQSLGHAGSAELRSTPASRMLERFDVLDTHGDPFPLDRLPGQALLAGRRVEDVVVQLRERGGGGEPRFAHIGARAIRGDDGALRFVVNTLRDVTEARRQQDAVEQARAEAVLASRAKDDFFAMLGHELRNPLAPILTSLELMKLQPSEQDMERAREVIERQVRSMVRLVDDLLDVSRIVHGRIELYREQVELAELVTKGLEVAGPSIAQRRHHVEVAVAPGLLVEVDPLRLVQVITNLLNNAAKYTEQGGHITVRGEREGSEVVLRVRDDGAGISPEMLPQIFDVFVQQPQAIDRAKGGLGLGLTIAKSLVELHGGHVTAHSEGVGHGSELVVRLPAAPAPAGSKAGAEA